MSEQNTMQIIKTIGEQGEEVYMKLQEIVTLNDKDYALLSIVEDDEEFNEVANAISDGDEIEEDEE